MKGSIVIGAGALGAAAFAPEASAHLVSTRFGELYSGLLHPLTGLQYIVAWLGLGLLGGLQRSRVAGTTLVAFPVAVLAGAGLASTIGGAAVFETAVFASFVVIGVLAALARDIPTPGWFALVVSVGLAHGLANGPDQLRTLPETLLYLTGVTLAAYLVLVLTMGSARAIAVDRQWGRLALRAGGSWVAAIGLIALGYTVLVPGL